MPVRRVTSTGCGGQLAQAALAGKSCGHAGIEFVEDLYEPFYAGRQFGIRDLNGYVLYFTQRAEGKS
jgi:hypothetical protein